MSTRSLLSEGSTPSQLVRKIREIGYNQDVTIEFATVTAAPPAIRIKIDGMKIELEADDLVIARSLTEHTRTATIDGGASVTISFSHDLNVGDRVIVAGINEGQTYIVLDRMVTY